MKTLRNASLFALLLISANTWAGDNSTPGLQTDRLKLKLAHEGGILVMAKENLVLKGSLKREHMQRNMLAGAVMFFGLVTLYLLARQKHAGPASMAATGTITLPTAENQHAETTLSRREKEILKQLVAGLSHKQIASECGITYHTVRYHIKNIYGKLKVKSLTEAVAVALRKKIVD